MSTGFDLHLIGSRPLPGHAATDKKAVEPAFMALTSRKSKQRKKKNIL
jgi:hypothetical protein